MEAEWTFKTEEELAHEKYTSELKLTENDSFIIAELKPNFTVTFQTQNGEVGRLDWSTGEMVFIGNPSPSAKLFFDFLKQYVDMYIKERLTEEIEKL